MATAQQKFEWITARIAEGRTVYLSTQLRATKITAKHLDAVVRVRGNALEVRNGSRWIDYSYTSISAR
jgi:hypothetical protein